MATFHENLVQSFKNFRDKYLKANGVTFQFSYDSSTGKFGYKDANGNFVPFRRVQASKTVSPSTSSQTVTPDSGYDGIASVTVNAISASSISPSSSGTYFSSGLKNMTSSGYAYSSRPSSPASRTLLWSNPSPTANYTGQAYVTSNYDIRNYDAIMVKYYGHKDLGTSSDNIAYSLFMSPSQLQEPSDGKNYKYCLLGFRGASSKYGRRVYLGRDYSDGKHIYISYANIIDATGTSAAACIPIAIYGINGLSGIKG